MTPGRDTRVEPPWVRPVVIIAATLVFMVLGAGGSMALGLSGILGSPRSATPGPAAVGFVQDLLAHDHQAVRDRGWDPRPDR